LNSVTVLRIITVSRKMSAQSFKGAINKEDFDIINQHSEIETYEVDEVSRIKCYSCRGQWVNCFAAKINEFEKTNNKMLGELKI
jgi:hypothetical protein